MYGKGGAACALGRPAWRTPTARSMRVHDPDFAAQPTPSKPAVCSLKKREILRRHVQGIAYEA